MYGFHFLVWFLCVRGIQDTQCGFKLLTRPAADLLFRNLHVNRWWDYVLLCFALLVMIPIILGDKWKILLFICLFLYCLPLPLKTVALGIDTHTFAKVYKCIYTSHRVHYSHSHPSTHPMPSWDLDQNRPTQKNKTAENLSSQVPNRCHIQREDYLSQDLSPPHPVLLATSPQTTLILFIFCLVIPTIPKWQVVYFNWLLLCPKVTL